MASTAADSTPRKRHSITPNSDLIIVVNEVSPRISGNTVVCVHELEVSKEVMSRNLYFNTASFSTSFADTGKEYYEVKKDDPHALKIWLQLLHGTRDKTSLAVDIASVWHVLVLARKYDFDALGEGPKKWFQEWYNQRAGNLTTGQCRELIYPAYTFDCAEGFAAITKHLAYNVQGHIQESRPLGVSTEQEEQRLRSRAIMVLNGARGSLKTKLHADLERPMLDLVKKAMCSSRKDVLWAYTSSLAETEAWPVEIKAKTKSINELHRLLEDFDYNDPHPTNARCTTFSDCGVDFEALIQNAISNSRKQFHGLCLDCMASSYKNKQNEDFDYWHHADRGIYDTTCRVKHGQPTWYFSFMGRKEKMDLFHKNKKDKKDARRYDSD